MASQEDAKKFEKYLKEKFGDPRAALKQVMEFSSKQKKKGVLPWQKS